MGYRAVEARLSHSLCKTSLRGGIGAPEKLQVRARGDAFDTDASGQHLIEDDANRGNAGTEVSGTRWADYSYRCRSTGPTYRPELT